MGNKSLWRSSAAISALRSENGPWLHDPFSVSCRRLGGGERPAFPAHLAKAGAASHFLWDLTWDNIGRAGDGTVRPATPGKTNTLNASGAVRSFLS